MKIIWMKEIVAVSFRTIFQIPIFHELARYQPEHSYKIAYAHYDEHKFQSFHALVHFDKKFDIVVIVQFVFTDFFVFFYFA